MAVDLAGFSGRVTVSSQGGVKNEWSGWVDGRGDYCPGEDKAT